MLKRLHFLAYSTMSLIGVEFSSVTSNGFVKYVAPMAQTVVWVGVHPCENIRLRQHQTRDQCSWKTPAWVCERLRRFGCEAPSFDSWTGSIDICGCIAISPGTLIDELVTLTNEEQCLLECPMTLERWGNWVKNIGRSLGLHLLSSWFESWWMCAKLDSA